jgi:hypothetical protein
MGGVGAGLEVDWAHTGVNEKAMAKTHNTQHRRKNMLRIVSLRKVTEKKKAASAAALFNF